MSKYLEKAKEIIRNKKTIKEQKHDLVREVLRQLNTQYQDELFVFIVNDHELSEELERIENRIHIASLDDTVTPEIFKNEHLKDYLDLHIKAYERIKNTKRTTY